MQRIGGKPTIVGVLTITLLILVARSTTNTNQPVPITTNTQQKIFLVKGVVQPRAAQLDDGGIDYIEVLVPRKSGGPITYWALIDQGRQKAEVGSEVIVLETVLPTVGIGTTYQSSPTNWIISEGKADELTKSHRATWHNWE